MLLHCDNEKIYGHQQCNKNLNSICSIEILNSKQHCNAINSGTGTPQTVLFSLQRTNYRDTRILFYNAHALHDFTPVAKLFLT